MKSFDYYWVMDKGNLISILEFAVRSGASESTIRRMLVDGRLKGKKMFVEGKERVMIDQSELVRLGFKDRLKRDK